MINFKKAITKTVAAATIVASALFSLSPAKVSALKAYMYELSESSSHVIEYVYNKKAFLGHRILRNGRLPAILTFDLYEQSLKKFREDANAIIAKNSELLMNKRLGILASWDDLVRLIVFKPDPEDDDLVSGMTEIFANAFNDVLMRINKENSDRAKTYGTPGQYDFTTKMTVFDADSLYSITRAVQPASGTHSTQGSRAIQPASGTHSTQGSRAIQPASGTHSTQGSRAVQSASGTHSTWESWVIQSGIGVHPTWAGRPVQSASGTHPTRASVSSAASSSAKKS